MRPQGAPTPQAEEWQREAQAVAASEVFSRSPRLRALLLFLVENTLQGAHEQLTEFEVGRQVFQRGADWVPADDSIVRSSVRQLRLKLSEYYAQADGAVRPWRIDIPRGSYVVSFRASSVSASADVLEKATSTSPPPVAAQPHARPWIFIGMAVLLAVSLAGNAILLTRNNSAAGATSRKMGLAASLVMQSDKQTRVVLDDYAHVLLNIIEGSDRNVTPDEYANRWYLSAERAGSKDPKILNLWQLLTTRYIVSLGTVATLDRLLRTVPDPNRLVTVHARSITAREFRRGNTILVGSKPNNPWVGMFEDELNFRRVSFPDGRVGFSNRNPRQGEEQVYSIPQAASINAGQGLAHVAYLPNGEGGFVLIVSGVNMVTAEAAGEYVTDPGRLPEIHRLLGVDANARLPHMEILLRTTAVDNSVHTASAIAWRRID